SQYLVVGANVPSNADTSDQEDDVEHQSVQHRRPFLEDDDDYDFGGTSPRRRGESFANPFSWDEDEDSPRQFLRRDPNPRLGISAPPRIPVLTSPLEETPLLSKKTSRVSFSPSPHPNHGPVSSPLLQSLSPVPNYQTASQPLVRRLSTASARSAKLVTGGGRSTFGQTLFNSIAILAGIGMLSEPLAFAYAGWGVGTVLIVSYGFIACYTAKILAKVILSDPRIRSYSDIGRKAFGPVATPMISFMFCLELFAVSVVLITLYGDSLHSLMPENSSNFYKAWGTVILIPMVFLPLSLLSYTSILGILSTVLMVVVVFVDGFSKKEAPGSLWSPAQTDFGIQSLRKLGSFRMITLNAAQFSGHAVIPSLARDMVDPSQFNRMINWAFSIAVFIYLIMGCAGYLMFGRNVSDEISLDLLATPGYNPLLNTICLWLLVISPLSKFGLNTQPLNTTMEILLGIDAPLTSPEDLADKPDGLAVSPKNSHFSNWRRVIGAVQRIVLVALSVGVSIVIPEFSSMMAFLGSFSAFMISIVGPVAAKIAIEKKYNRLDIFIIVVGTIMALWGTVAAFA
ncbi:transmembrane amino acid transporter protein-domain-containing protein, partial [Crepidotus variabilis]